ncbi:hypothetical protein [Leifsonia xyli]|jgi:N,N'-diacetylchitobiose transport system substrate-binding protein|uniref:hypothetical protein n=1 Tax=Leifsonia xyli TaxID=1575 RepID=UPI000409475C|nr:hypothetical protein [Leifsonia xyli]
MKKRYLSIAALTVAVLGLTACSSGDSGDGGPIDAKGQKLTVWIMQGTNPESTSFFKEVGDEFKKETGATLDVQFVQ